MRQGERKASRLATILGRYAVSLCLAALAAGLAAPADAGTPGPAPAAGKAVKAQKNQTRVSSGFGTRSDPLGKAKRFHKGLDITGPAGQSVLSYRAQTQHSCHQVSSSFEQVSGCQGHDKYIKNFSLLYRAWRFCAGGRCPSPCSC